MFYLWFWKRQLISEYESLRHSLFLEFCKDDSELIATCMRLILLITEFQRQILSPSWKFVTSCFCVLCARFDFNFLVAIWIGKVRSVFKPCLNILDMTSYQWGEETEHEVRRQAKFTIEEYLSWIIACIIMATHRYARRQTDIFCS